MVMVMVIFFEGLVGWFGRGKRKKERMCEVVCVCVFLLFLGEEMREGMQERNGKLESRVIYMSCFSATVTLNLSRSAEAGDRRLNGMVLVTGE